LEILITGATGLLGGHLIDELQKRGDRVRILALPGEDTSAQERRGIAVHRGDIRLAETLTSPMEGVDGLLHLAAMMGVWRPLEDYRAVNVAGTENVCRAALKAGVRRIVHISSWTVYGMNLPEPATEDMPLRPLQEPYALTKAEGDVLVRKLIAEEGLPAAIIRPGTFFGPGDRLHFGRIADRIRAGSWISIGSGRNALPFVYVTDVVQGLLLALDHERALGQAFNITNDRPLTQGEMWSAIASEIGAEPPRLWAPYHALFAAGYVAEQVARVTRSRKQPPVTRLGAMLFGGDNRHSIEKARRELGFAPRVPLREGVMLAAAWYRDQNHLSTQRQSPALPRRPVEVDPDRKQVRAHDR
jgi:nucleoside-diphosphate-sugar epimerase